MTPRLAGLTLAVMILAGCGGVTAVSAPAVITPSPASVIPSVTPSAPAVIPSSSAAVTHPAATRTHRPRPGVLIAIADEGYVSYSVTLRAGQCRARDAGRLPDPSCTPGSTDPAVTQATIGSTICVRGWTATVRPPSSQTNHAKFGVAEPAYGIYARGELDHLIPLELGGSNDITNLWIEAGVIPNSKDSVENGLRAAVCAGRVTLRAARLAIARNWETAPVPAGPPAPAPVRTSHAAAAPVPASSSPAAPSSCYPRTSGGNCYRAGEYCRIADRGTSGIAGNGSRITCVDKNGTWRWEALWITGSWL